MDERGASEVGTVIPPGGGTGSTGSGQGSTNWASDQPSAEQSGSTKDVAKDKARDVAATTTGEARQVAGTATEGAREVARETGRQVGEVAGQAADQARQMLSQTTDQLMEQASTQTGRAAEGLRTVTSQLQALSTGRPEEAGAVGDYARQLTSKLEGVAGRLEDGGFEGILDDVQRFSRRRPGVFLLGAATAGFFAGRFIRGNQAAQSSDTGSMPSTGGVAQEMDMPRRDLYVEQDALLVAEPPDLIVDAPIGTDLGRPTGAL